MFYILNFDTHEFISCDSANKVITEIQNLLKQGTHQSSLEVINGLGEEVRFDINEFSGYCKNLSLVEQADLDALSLALNKEGGLKGDLSFDERYPKREYEYTVEYELDGKAESFEFHISSRFKPTTNDVMRELSRYLSAKLDLATAKAAFAAINFMNMVVTQNDEYIDSDELVGEDLEQFLADHAEEFDIRAVYSAVWSALEEAGDEFNLDVESQGYKTAISLLKGLCSRISPEIRDMAFESNCGDLVFKGSKLGYSIFYYNPDSVMGGQIVECPFDVRQAARMLDGIDNDGNMEDILCENTQYLSDINTVHFFNTVQGLLYAKLDGDYLGEATKEVLQEILREQQNEKVTLSEQIRSAAGRAAGPKEAEDDLICRVIFCRTGGVADLHQFDIELKMTPVNYKAEGELFLLEAEERVQAYEKAAEKVGKDTLSDYSILSARMLTAGRGVLGASDKEIVDIKRQLINRENETSYGEPQAWVELNNGRSIEVTLEQEGLEEKEYFFTARLHCNENEYENETFHGTGGVIDQYNSAGSNMDEIDGLIRQALLCNEKYPVSEPELEFVFDEEIMVSDDMTKLEGYLWAMSSLVNRLKAQEPPLEEDQFMENINFYPVYDVLNGTVSMEGHYYLEDTHYARGKGFTLPLTSEESARLIAAFETYCNQQEGKSCLEFLNQIREQEGLEGVSPRPSLANQIDAASEQAAEVRPVAVKGKELFAKR